MIAPADAAAQSVDRGRFGGPRRPATAPHSGICHQFARTSADPGVCFGSVHSGAAVRSAPLAGRQGQGDLGGIWPSRGPGVCQRSLAAAWCCSTTLAGMRPRSLSAMPAPFARARIPPLRSRLAAVRPGRRRCACPALRAWSMKGASCRRNAAAFFLLRSIAYVSRRSRNAPSHPPGLPPDRLRARRLSSLPSRPPDYGRPPAPYRAAADGIAGCAAGNSPDPRPARVRHSPGPARRYLGRRWPVFSCWRRAKPMPNGCRRYGDLPPRHQAATPPAHNVPGDATRRAPAARSQDGGCSPREGAAKMDENGHQAD
jgi:hypothetical protein